MKKTFENWLVVSDIDGTLKDKKRSIPKNNKEAIQRFMDKGGNFTLASGRLVSSLERNYNRVNPNQPAIVLNGAGIYDFNKKEMIWRSTIEKEGRELVKKIYSEYGKILHRLDVGIFFDDKVYIIRNGLLSKGQMYFDKSHYVISSIEDVPEEGWMKVIFWSNPVTIAELKDQFTKMDNLPVNFMASSAWSLEMLQKDTHKGVGVMRLADELGIDKDHVAAIGDYYNDWDMLKTVGYPACAGQAPDSIHDICKYEACHCNDGCVADLIEHIMSGKAEADIIRYNAATK